MKYLAIRIIEAIAASDLLENSKKIDAINDIALMYKNADYAKEVDLSDYRIKQIAEDPKMVDIADHHIWNKSKLGYHFWGKMYVIIGKV